MNDFDKTLMLAFYNSFLKIELNCDNFLYMGFSKEDIVKLNMIYSLK